MPGPGVPVSMPVAANQTVNAGTFTVVNTSGTTLVAPQTTISFDSANFFSSATLTATVPVAPAGPVSTARSNGSFVGAAFQTSTATLNPIVGGNSPQQPNNTIFVLQPPLVIPTGQSATFSLEVTVVANPKMTRWHQPVTYAVMVAGGSTGSNIFLIVLALFEFCAAGMSRIKRRRVLMMLLLLLGLACQVGCDNGSVSGPPPSVGVVYSNQTALQVSAMKQANHEPVTFAGLPLFMGSVWLK
jgi:hypothetical protein